MAPPSVDTMSPTIAQTPVTSPIVTPPYQAVIFDLDGTLVDSTLTLANATNFALMKLGYKSFTVNEIRPMLGGGTRKLVTRALTKALNGETPAGDLIDRACVFKMEYEGTQEARDAKVPFPHVHGMLQRLNDAGIQMAVLSNSKEENVQKIVMKHFGNISWKHIAGARTDTPLKPNPLASLRIQNKYMDKVAVGKTCFVGDSEFDMKTALNSNMTPIAVPWGIRDIDTLVDNGAHVVAGDMNDIASFILGDKSRNAFSGSFRQC